MADTLTQKCLSQISGTFVNAIDLESASDSTTNSTSTSFTDGTTTGKCDQKWSDTRQVAGGAVDVLDLAGSLTNVFGATVTFAKVKCIYINNKTTTAASDNLEIGDQAGTGNAFSTFVKGATQAFIVPAGGHVMLVGPVDGFAVTAGTGDQLYIKAAGANPIDYDIVLLGTTV